MTGYLCIALTTSWFRYKAATLTVWGEFVQPHKQSTVAFTLEVPQTMERTISSAITTELFILSIKIKVLTV